MSGFDEIRIAEILAAKATGALSPEHEEELGRWLAHSQANREMYERIMSGESLRFREENFGTTDTALAGRQIARKIGRRTMRRVVARASAAAAVAAVAVLALYYISPFADTRNANVAETHQAILSLDNGRRVVLTAPELADEWMHYAAQATDYETDNETLATGRVRIEVERGKEYRLRLPDSTMVWLNSESAIEYPCRFADGRRDVSLSGEAFFDVKNDPDNPFVITIPNEVTVRVLGTKFNVNSYADIDEAQVSLVEGLVSVGHNGNNVTLHPNQQAVFNRGSHEFTVRDVTDASIYAAWINGMFDFERERIEVILNAMGKWYDLEFCFDDVDETQLGHFTISTERGNDFSQVCGILEKITGLKYRLNGRTVHITRQ
ncbi:FecR domain-containing protein [Alistipes sp. OttesenSCG-928-B03]|nr:FecR domain-containing protein [Alistipes sp. OttesenSCG-928-B03]